MSRTKDTVGNIRKRMQQTERNIQKAWKTTRKEIIKADCDTNIKLGQGGLGSVYVKNKGRPVVRKLFQYQDEEMAIKEFYMHGSLPPSCFYPRLETDHLSYLRNDLTMRQYPIIDMSYDPDAVDLAKATLNRDTRRQKPLNKKVIIGDLILAIQTLQEIGVLHMDLKPENCLILPNSHLKLIDFGHSCKFEEEVKLTGTIGYCSPQLLAKSIEQESFKPTIVRRDVHTWPSTGIHHHR